MNLCIIRTTKGGDIPKGSSKAVPSALDGIKAGGKTLDKKLLDILFQGKEKDFRDEVKNSHIEMLEIERRKIDVINKLLNQQEERPRSRAKIRNEKAYLEIEMIRKAFDQLWTQNIQQKINHIINVSGIDKIDLVLLAGGSSRIPFIRDAIADLLQLGENQIIQGKDFEQAVACGSAYVASERLASKVSEARASEAEEKLISFISDEEESS